MEYEIVSVEYFSMISCALGKLEWRFDVVSFHVSSNQLTSSKPIWIFCLEDVPSQHELAAITTENE
jgi:hypothetical protein